MKVNVILILPVSFLILLLFHKTTGQHLMKFPKRNHVCVQLINTVLTQYVLHLILTCAVSYEFSSRVIPIAFLRKTLRGWLMLYSFKYSSIQL